MFHRFVWAHFILTYEIVNQTVLSTYVFGPVYFLYKRRYYIYLFYCMASTERKGSVLKELKNKALTHLFEVLIPSDLTMAASCKCIEVFHYLVFE